MSEYQKKCLCCGQVIEPGDERERFLCHLDSDSVLQLIGDVCGRCAEIQLEERGWRKQGQSQS